jgi:RNA polymerase sigma-70 factor, ECF subfamily
MSEDLRGLVPSANLPTVPVEAEAASRSLIGSADDLLLLHKLRAGDEAVFAFLFDQYYPAMSRLALLYVSNRTIAEEVVQEAWMGVLQGLGRFEGRSSLKTWMFRILLNVAKTRCQREGRSVPFSSLWEADAESIEPAFDAARYWISCPRSWDADPEERLLAQETRLYIQAAIEALPLRQRIVITLRDVEGWTAREVIDLLGISETNQRVLLHRARTRVRHALHVYFDEEGKVELDGVQ